MKTIYKIIYSLTFCLLTIISVAQPDNIETRFEKKREIKQVYDISPKDKVFISNKFGSIKINTWESNTIKTAISIIVEATTEERAQEVFDGIKIDYSKSNNQIRFATNLKTTTNVDGMKNKSQKWVAKSGRQRISIDYEIYLPNNIFLDLQNEFGSIMLDDYAGDLDIDNKFGPVIAKALTGKENNISLQYGNAEIASLTNANLYVSYGSVDVGKLIGENKLRLSYCSQTSLGLTAETSLLNISNSYSTIDLLVDSDSNLSFDLKAAYGNIKNKNKSVVENIKAKKSDDDYPNYNYNPTKQFNAVIGNGKGLVKIHSDYGNIKLS